MTYYTKLKWVGFHLNASVMEIVHLQTCLYNNLQRLPFEQSVIVA